MCGSDSDAAKATDPTKVEKWIRGQQLGIFKGLADNIPGWESVLMEQLGLSQDEDGSITRGPKDEIQGLLEERMKSALEGNLDLSPALEADLKEEEQMLRETYSRKFGSDYENTSPWQSAYNDFLTRKHTIREESRMGLLELGSGLLGERETTLGNEFSQLFNMAQAPPGMNLLEGGNLLQEPYMFDRSKEGEMAIAKGQQTSQGSEALGGGMCCFIFIAVHGRLHPIVRQYRNEHMTVRNRRGYYWLADRLVPLMGKHKTIENLVDWLMVKPMTAYGKWFYGLGRTGWAFYPVTKFWLTAYDVLGHRPPYTRQGTNETV